MNTTPNPNTPAPATAIDETWRLISQQLRGQMGSAEYSAYIRASQAVDYRDGTFTIAAPSAYACAWLTSRMTSTLQRHLAPLLGAPVRVRFVVAGEGDPAAVEQSAKEQPALGQPAAEKPSQAVNQPVIHAGMASAPEPVYRPKIASAARTDASTGNLPGATVLPVKKIADTQAGTTTGPETSNQPVTANPTRTEPVRIANTAQSVMAAPVASSHRLVTQEAARTDPTRQPETESTQSSDLTITRADGTRETVQGAPNLGELITAQVHTQPAATLPPEPVTLPSSPAALRANEPITLTALDDTLEAALTQAGKIIAFPRYELRHIPLVGPEAFFLRLAFLQQRYFHTTSETRERPFETTVEALLRWAHVGRATLHRFKKGDPARGQAAAAGWFGIEQLPNGPRSGQSPQQPPCRYRVQQGIPLTAPDAGDLYQCLVESGIQDDPLAALQRVIERPIQQILRFPPPAVPDAAARYRQPEFISPARVVSEALDGRKIPPTQRAAFQELVSRLSDHITMPQQMVFVSWYFMQHWLPELGHDAAAMILFTRAQGYYNPQEHELRDEITVSGGYHELANVIGLKRDRTIADWLPNIFDRDSRDKVTQPVTSAPDPRNQRGGVGESAKWQREQQRQQQTQALIANFIQVVPGSRKKMPEGHYAFRLKVAIQGEPLTPRDHALRAFVQRVLDDCHSSGVLAHFHAWVTSAVIEQRAGAADIDGAGTLGGFADAVDAANPAIISQNDGTAQAHHRTQNDGAGILGKASQPEQVAQTIDQPENTRAYNDGWGILAVQAAARTALNEAKQANQAAQMTESKMTAGDFAPSSPKITACESPSAAAKLTAGESTPLDPDGWGTLVGILNDGWENLASSQLTARELFKGLLRLNTFWDTILDQMTTSENRAGAASQPAVVVGQSGVDAQKGAFSKGTNGTQSGLSASRTAIHTNETNPKSAGMGANITGGSVLQAETPGSKADDSQSERLIDCTTGTQTTPADPRTDPRVDDSTGPDTPHNPPAADWDLRAICQRNGGLNRFRERILARETSPVPFLSWLWYAYSFKGRGIADPVGWALARINTQAGSRADGPFARLAAQSPARLANLIQRQIESGVPPADEDWAFAFRNTPTARLREMAEVLGL